VLRLRVSLLRPPRDCFLAGALDAGLQTERFCSEPQADKTGKNNRPEKKSAIDETSIRASAVHFDNFYTEESALNVGQFTSEETMKRFSILARGSTIVFDSRTSSELD
jgi:hypothetical protein